MHKVEVGLLVENERTIGVIKLKRRYISTRWWKVAAATDGEKGREGVVP